MVARDGPRALLVLVATGGPIVVPVERAIPCDFDLVDRILWLYLLARRVGWTLRLEDVDDELHELLDLAGVARCLMPR